MKVGEPLLGAFAVGNSRLVGGLSDGELLLVLIDEGLDLKNGALRGGGGGGLS